VACGAHRGEAQRNDCRLAKAHFASISFDVPLAIPARRDPNASARRR
jgi:hypothetical protein